MSKLFKSYKTMDEYNADKISISKDNLTYVQSGAEYMTSEVGSDVVTYNKICFIEDGGYIYRNNQVYGGSGSESVDIPNASETQNGLMTTTYVKNLAACKEVTDKIDVDKLVTKNANGSVSITSNDVTAIYGSETIQTGDTSINIADLLKDYNKVEYDDSTKHINFYHDSNLLAYVDCDEFIISGFVKDVTTDDSNFIFTFALENGGESTTTVAFSKIFKASDYYKANAIDDLLKEKQDTLVSETNIKSITIDGTSYTMLGSGTVNIELPKTTNKSVYYLKVHLYSSSDSYYSVVADFILNEEYTGSTIADFTTWLKNQGYNSTSNIYPCSGIAGKHTGSGLFSSITVGYIAKWLYTSSNGKTLYCQKEDDGTDTLSSNCNKIQVIQTQII